MAKVDETLDAAVLRRVSDELEIRNAVARLAHLADTATIDELDQYVALFTEDGTWAVLGGGLLPAQERRGRGEIIVAARDRRLAGIQGPGTSSRHIISTIAVVFDSPDRAQVRSYLQVFRDTMTDHPTPAGVGEYHDTFTRTPEGWKIQRREVISG